MGDTKIQWTDKTWNPVRGCSRVSQGCVNCYAERQAARFAAPGQPFSGFVRVTSLASGLQYENPQAAGDWHRPQWTGKVELVEKHLQDPLHWKKPCRIFVNSMSDLFHENLPDEAIDRVFAVMALCPQHTFQVLTKRPKRMLQYSDFTFDNREDGIGSWMRYYSKGSDPGIPDMMPLPNVWLGVSVEDQQTADERIPLLLQTPAAVRFVSYEPALGPVDFQKAAAPFFRDKTVIQEFKPLLGVDQIIVGGESGPGARPFHIDWAREVIEQCKAAHAAAFFKQAGSNCVTVTPLTWPEGTKFNMVKFVGIPLGVNLKDRKGGDPLEWPIDTRVRQFPA